MTVQQMSDIEQNFGAAKCKRLKVITQCLLPILMWSLQGLNGGAQAADLLDVYHLARERDPTYEAGYYALQAVQEKLPQARASLLPQVSANATRSLTHGLYSFGTASESDRNLIASGWAVQLTQPLVRVQYGETYRQAEFVVEQAKAQFALVEQDLILRTAQAYFDFDVARESLRVADARVVAMAQQLKLNKNGFAAGINDLTDVYEAQARLDLAHSQSVAVRNDLEFKSAELEKIIGTLPLTLNALSAEAQLSFPEPNLVQHWVTQASNDSLSVRLQRAAVGVAEKEVAKNQATHLPTLDLTASYGRNYSSGSTTLQDYNSRSRAAQIGLQMNVPLYAGGLVNSKVREATGRFYQAKAELEIAERLASTNARQAFAGVNNEMARVQALGSEIASRRHAVKGNQIGLKLGTRTNIDVLNAEQQLYTSQRDWVKARYDVLLQGLKLKAAAGRLTETDVLNVNSMFTVIH